LNYGIVEHAAAFAPLLSFAVTYSVIFGLRRSPLARLALDYPNSRSLHEQPTPRIGGIGVIAGFCAAVPLVPSGLPWPIWPALLLLAAVSLLDDVRGAPVTLRFAAHLTAAALFVWHVGSEAWGPAVSVFAALAMAWMINLYNFMDGSDGLAGGMTFFGFFFYGMAAALDGTPVIAIFSFTVAAAGAAFLCYNFPPARMFLGDGGAVPLGFLAAALGLLGWQQGIWPAWFPVLVFSPFVIDASMTLVRRALRRERLWQAHFDHYYQRLIRIGWSRRRTAIAEYLLMAGCGLVALCVRAAPPAVQIGALASVLLLYAVFAGTIDRAWRRHQQVADR
jgi:UDP-N-acetylmuramyl pentapeptide phosphotransferase/UDP-N-acetylglucosamine-1-phosphate transferase